MLQLFNDVFPVTHIAVINPTLRRHSLIDVFALYSIDWQIMFVSIKQRATSYRPKVSSFLRTKAATAFSAS